MTTKSLCRLFLCLVLALGLAAVAQAESPESSLDLPVTAEALAFPAAAEMTPVDAEPVGELDWLAFNPGGECGFPRPAPSPSCACGTCCDCNRCYNGGRLQKCLEGP